MNKLTLSAFENLFEQLRHDDAEAFIIKQLNKRKSKLYILNDTVTHKKHVAYTDNINETRIKIINNFTEEDKAYYIMEFDEESYNYICRTCRDEVFLHEERLEHYKMHNDNDKDKVRIFDEPLSAIKIINYQDIFLENF